MVLTFTEKISLGYQAPSFELPEPLSGRLWKTEDFKAEFATVVMFLCNHCPYVKHVNAGLVQLANDYLPLGVKFVAISSNDVSNYPDDAPEKMAEVARELAYPFPYLYDETQTVAKAYHASCTPDFSVFDSNLRCVYRGQLDESRPKSDLPVTGESLRAALDALLAGEEIKGEQIPSAGCNIKWKE